MWKRRWKYENNKYEIRKWKRKHEEEEMKMKKAAWNQANLKKPINHENEENQWKKSIMKNIKPNMWKIENVLI